MVRSIRFRARALVCGAALLLVLQVASGSAASAGSAPSPLVLSADMAIAAIVA